jgi:Cu2+-exporting ATPase
VLSVDINYTSHRARVCWDNSRIKLSQILEAISAIGYRAHPYDAERQRRWQKQRKQAISRLWAAGLSMMQVMMYAVPVYLAPDGDIDPDFLWLLHWASLILTLPVMLYSPFLLSEHLARPENRPRRHGHAGHHRHFHLFLCQPVGADQQDSARRVFRFGIDVCLPAAGRALSGRHCPAQGGRGNRKPGQADSGVCPPRRQLATSRDTEEATVTMLNPGDVILVKPGETIPGDGVVLDGSSAANESLISGESKPLPRTLATA